MSASVDEGRGRSGLAVVNLVPMVDLLSTCITFLVATAVWTEVSALPGDQGGSTTATSDDAPLVLRLRPDGGWVGREADGSALARVGAGYDWRELGAALDADAAAHPDRALVVAADDGVPYAQFVKALDVAAAHGFTHPAVGAP